MGNASMLDGSVDESGLIMGCVECEREAYLLPASAL